MSVCLHVNNMDIIKAYILFAIFGISSAFLMQDIIANKTSSVTSSGHSSAETTDQSIYDLMTFLAEEKRLRYQLEQRLDETERKLKTFDQFHDAVTAELQNERNTNSRLEEMYNGLKQELNNASIAIENILKLVQKNEESVLNNITQFMTEYKGSSNGSCVGKDHMVAFTAEDPLSLNPLRFNDLFEIGGAYNISTGQLVCNQPGVYFLTYTTVQGSSGTYQDCCIYINTHKRINSCAVSGGGNGEFPSGSRSVIVRLHMNDEVSVHCSNGSKMLDHSSGFTGFLIQAEH